MPTELPYPVPELEEGIREPRFIAFAGETRIAAGALADVARDVKRVSDRGIHGSLLIFDDTTSQPLELDLRGSLHAVIARHGQSEAGRPVSSATTLAGEGAEAEARGPGRPRLGVVGREVTLLPRHWEWLNDQPGGASAALRRLVEQARSANVRRDRRRRAQESAYRFMSAMLGDHPGFEEALRALFAGDAERYMALSEPWPADPRDHARRLAAAVFNA